MGNNDGAGADGIAAGCKHAFVVIGLRGVKVEEFEASAFVAVVVGEDESGCRLCGS